MTNLKPSFKFRENFINLLYDLKDDFEKIKPEISASLETVISLSELIVDNEYFVKNFLEIVDNGTTLRADYEEGNYFKVLQAFLEELSVSYALELHKEIQFDLLSDSQKDAYIEYLKSFFNISNNYLKEEKKSK